MPLLLAVLRRALGPSALAFGIFAALVACSSNEPGSFFGAGGAPAGQGGGAMSPGGTSTSGQGGAALTGGGGGSVSGVGGGVGSNAGMPGTSGGVSVAGRGATGAGAGGQSDGGGRANAQGGASAGVGGVEPTAGAGGAMAAAGGRNAGGMAGDGPGGSGMAGRMGSDLTVVGAWDGALLKFPCGNTHDAYNCSNTDCSNNQTTKTTEWTIGGTSGAVYDVTVNVRGVVEAYYYPGATRDGGSIKSDPDLFASGGQAQDSSGSNYDYNTYQVVVTPPVAGAPNVYFLNSVTMAENPHASNSPTSHVTFPINYTKTIKVTGGGKVTFTTFDSNCTFLQNCGPAQGSTCMAPRTVSLDGVTPAPPAAFTQPFEQPTGAWGQWVYFDVTEVLLAQ